jgi:hypothetical protein
MADRGDPIRPAIRNGAVSIDCRPAIRNGAVSIDWRPAVRNGAVSIDWRPAVRNGADSIDWRPDVRSGADSIISGLSQAPPPTAACSPGLWVAIGVALTIPPA